MEKSNRPHIFEEPSPRDAKHEFSGGKRKRGRKNAQKTPKHKRALDGGLEGHNEKLIGHKNAGESHKNVDRRYE